MGKNLLKIYNGTNYTPKDVDPTSPDNGDIFYASSTHATKDEGFYAYEAGGWIKVAGGIASTTTYDNSTSGLTATNVQDAVDEVESRVDGIESDTGLSDHLSDAVDAHDATAVSYDNSTSGLTATDSQSAIDEVESRVDTAESDISTHTGASSGVHGVTGDVVGTSDTQTMTNKLLLGPTITSPNNSNTSFVGETKPTAPGSGSVKVYSNSNILYKLGSDNNEHEIVNTGDSQTMTNKTLTSPTVNGGTVDAASITNPSRLDVKKDTRANLDTYALTAANGQLCFATDEKKMYQVLDSGLSAVGGGGVGSESIYAILDADDFQDMTDWTFTGSSSGTINTTNPLSGDKDFKLTFTASGEIATSQNISLPLRSQPITESYITHEQRITINSSAAENQAILKFYDATNTKVIGSVYLKNGQHEYSILGNLNNSDNPTAVKFSIEAFEACTVQFGKVVFDDSPFRNVSLTESFGYIEYGDITDTAGNMIFNLDGQGSTNNDLYEINNTSVYTRITAKKDFEFTANIMTSCTDVNRYIRIYLYDSSDNLIAQTLSNRTQYAGSQINASMNGRMKAGDYVYFYQSGTIAAGDTSTLGFTATKVSENIVVQEDRKQAHEIVSLKLQGNDNRAITGGTEDIHFHGTGTGWTSSGDSHYYTVQEDNSIIEIDTMVRCSANALNFLMLYADTGTGFAEHQWIGEYVNYSGHKGTYTSKSGEFSKGDKLSIRMINSQSLSNDSQHHLNIVEKYLPPVEEASMPTLYAIPQSEENQYNAVIENNGTASILSESSNFIESVSRTAPGKVTVNFKSGIFTIAPAVRATVVSPNNSSNPHNIDVNSITTSGFNVIIQNNGAASGVWEDNDFVIEVVKQGVDYTGGRVFIGNVAKRKVVRYTQAAQTLVSGYTNLVFDTKDFGNYNNYNTTNGEFTADFTGPLRINAKAVLADTGNFSGTETLVINAFVNGVVVTDFIRRPYSSEDYPSIYFNDVLYVNEGDVVELRLLNGSGVSIDTINSDRYNSVVFEWED